MELTSYIKTDWREIVENYIFNYLPLLDVQLSNEYANKIIFPKKEDIFKCFNYFNIKDTKVVILGQDPYHNYNEAMGLSFSVYNDVKIPSSLKNIFKELNNDLNIKRNNSDLSDWAIQGILLLNSTLTVELNKPNSHRWLKWDKLTDYIISYLDKNVENVIFILMGNFAKQKKKLINNSKYIIETVHPSGLSASKGFFGSKIFSRTNKILEELNKDKIKW